MGIIYNPTGFTILCDENGIIKKVWRDDTGLNDLSPVGMLFSNLIIREFRHKSLNFLLEIKKNHLAQDYNLDLLINNKCLSFVFIGVMLDNEILIVAAANNNEAFDFINHLQEINNEQANAIRQLVKNQTHIVMNSSNKEQINFDEFTQLNNELVNLQRELAKKNAELVRLNEIKNRFLGMAAHDLRNPLCVISSYSEFLIEDTQEILPEEDKKFLNIIYDSTNFMLRLIEDLLDITKIESGKIELNIVSINIQDFLSKIVSLNNVLSAPKGIEIILESNNNGLIINADALKLEQVFNNLISNAIKFSMPKTSIVLTLGIFNGFVTIAVKDQGQGIPEDELSNIFKPFEKTSVKSTAGEKSTGLGLSITKRIIEAHKGNIKVESIVGNGTIFYVNLPL